MRLVWVIGFRIKFNNRANLPTDRPIIVVSNHQGTYDIPPLFGCLESIIQSLFQKLS